MRVVFRMSAIVAALAVATSAALTGCGQRGPLYLPTVPPLPEKPVLQTEPSASSPDADLQVPSGTSTTSKTSARSARAPLTLAPADSLGTTTPRTGGATPVPAPDNTPDTQSSPASDQ